MLVVIGGKPGSGKTTLAQELLKMLKFDLVSRDEAFQELFVRLDVYSVEHKKLAFERCLMMVEESIKAGRKVILDMPFSRNDELWRAYEQIRLLKSEWRLLYLVCGDEIARKRIAEQKNNWVKKELRINTRTEELPRELPMLKVNTERPVVKYLRVAIKYINGG